MNKSRDYIITLPAWFKPTLRMRPEYRNWSAIKSRCTNKKFDKKKRYVWRGITMCNRWKIGEGGLSGFECFLSDMGCRPTEKHTVERKDNDGHYCKENCVWATNKQQSNNRSNNRRVTYKGVTSSMMELSERVGMSYYVLRNRIARGWPVKSAVEAPFGTSFFERKTARGPQLPQTKLTEKSVREIRRAHSTGKFRMMDLAKKFGISPANACLIVNRKSWKHVL